MNLVIKWGKRNKRDRRCFKTEETTINWAVDKLSAIVGEGRTGKEKKIDVKI